MTTYKDPLNDNEDTLGRKTKVRWRNCILASFTGLQEAASGNAQAFVWPDEGAFAGSIWDFNTQHQEQFEPLVVDKINAGMMIALHDALSDQNQAKFQEWVGQSRGHFAYLWELTQQRVTITGFKGR